MAVEIETGTQRVDQTGTKEAMRDACGAMQINPLAGCLPTLATIPVFIGLYRALSNVAEEGLLSDGFFWIPSLGGPTTLAAQKAVRSSVTIVFSLVVVWRHQNVHDLGSLNTSALFWTFRTGCCPLRARS